MVSTSIDHRITERYPGSQRLSIQRDWDITTYLRDMILPHKKRIIEWFGHSAGEIIQLNDLDDQIWM